MTGILPNRASMVTRSFPPILQLVGFGRDLAADRHSPAHTGRKTPRSRTRKRGLKSVSAIPRLLVIWLYLVSYLFTHGHDYGLRGEYPLNWRTDQIQRVVATRVNFLSETGRLIRLDGRKCLQGSGFSFDVDDSYAFDLDETVEVDVDFYLGDNASKIELTYERNGEAEATRTAQIPAFQSGSRVYGQTFVLDRARFANRSLYHTDFSINLDLAEAEADPRKEIIICGIKLRRSGQTPVPRSFGNIALEVLDEMGHAVPARVGIYDSTDRLPLPSEEAVTIKRLDETFRVINLPRALIPWPARNPSAFYIDGQYHAKLPEGRYELVVAKGPEYRIARQEVEIAGNQTKNVRVELQRWENLPGREWYSGDEHIHYIRHSPNDDPGLLLFTQAEDLHVANILQMGNIARVIWPDYDWEPQVAALDPSYSFVPGQEDPRTARVGHTISLDLREPIRDPQHYLIYRPIFEKARTKGAVTGYAHVTYPTVYGPGGLALDLPFGLVDFVEILQAGILGTDQWFDFLNLGYKLAPTAGTDYMWDRTLPGAERSYVHVPSPFTLHGWFDGLKRGATFVTNGPMLEFTGNGKSMGSELHLKPGDEITIEASASVNPDIDFLGTLKLIEQGEVIKTVTAQGQNETTLKLHFTTKATHGSWFVVRADGIKPHTGAAENGSGVLSKLAVSGAIYVDVDGQGTWKPTAVPAIVGRIKESMKRMLMPETGFETAPWETHGLTYAAWDAQKTLLQQRIEEVLPIYDRLVDKAKVAEQDR